MLNLICIVLLYTLFFALYLELNPSITNVWYRTGSDGLKHIYPSNLFYFIIEPIKTKELWFPEFLDCNYFFGLFIVLFVYLMFIKS
jgi:hypothetical protein